MMKIVFRTDASLEIGMGHVMRCLTLADELKVHGAEISFVFREMPVYLVQSMEKKGFETICLSAVESRFQPERGSSLYASWLTAPWKEDADETITHLDGDVDWIIIDHYAIDKRWHKQLRPYVGKIFVIDDLADRQLDCDVLLDQTYGRKRQDYHSVVSEKCKLLIGSQYALLRPEFSKLRPEALSRRQQCDKIRRILVFMGGGKGACITRDVLKGLELVPWNQTLPEIDVVMNSKSHHLQDVLTQAKRCKLSVNILTDVENMAELMAKADLAIGAGGTTSWERCCLGLPTLTLVTAENQRKLVDKLVSLGATRNLGEVSSLIENLVALLTNINENKLVRDEMSDLASGVVDGLGVFKVALCLINSENLISLREAEMADSDLILSWQKDPVTRKYSRNPAIPSDAEHKQWYRDAIANPNRQIFIVECKKKPVGLVRIDTMSSSEEMYEVSIIIASGWRGKNIAKRALALLRGEKPFAILKAEVLEGNTASSKLFQSSGYFKVNSSWYVNTPDLL